MQAMRFLLTAVQPGAAQLLAGVTKIELRGSVRVHASYLVGIWRCCPTLRSLLLGETGTHWSGEGALLYTPPSSFDFGILNSGILGELGLEMLGTMECLTELQLELSILEAETTTRIGSRLPSLPATLTDFGLYFSSW